MTRVYVILVNWNGWRDTLECLESVFRSSGIEARVVVCDNASTDNSLEQIKKWADGNLVSDTANSDHLKKLASPPVEKPVPYVEYDRRQAEAGGDKGHASSPLILVNCGENLGFAGGNNVGLRYAIARKDYDFVWLLNNDTVVEPTALRELVDRMQLDPNIGMCGSTLLHYEMPYKVQALGGGYYCKWVGLPWHIGQLRRCDQPIRRKHVERWMNYVVGASLCVSRAFVETIGLMDEDYFLFFEETDWAARSRGRFSLGFADGSVVYHKLGKSIGTSRNPKTKSLVCDFFALRNRLKFTRRYHPVAMPTVYAGIIIGLVRRCLAGRWDLARMILDILSGRAGKWQKSLLLPTDSMTSKSAG